MVAGTSLVPLRTLAQGENAAKPAIEGSEKSGGQAADQSASEAIENAKEATNEAIEAAKQAILKAIDQAKQKASSALATEKEATARAMEKTGEATRVLDQAADAARDVLDKAKRATEEVLEKAKEAVQQRSEAESRPLHLLLPLRARATRPRHFSEVGHGKVLQSFSPIDRATSPGPVKARRHQYVSYDRAMWGRAKRKARWRAQFARLGIERVQHLVEAGAIGPDRKREAAIRWLHEQEHGAERREKTTFTIAIVAAIIAVSLLAIFR